MSRGLAQRTLYRLMRRLVRLVLKVFFRRIDAVGAEGVPLDRPVLFAANHPNEMLDPFLIAYFHPGRVNFLGKSTLFAFPPFGWFLRSLGCIPVYRQRDAQADMSKNEETFRECRAVLAGGEAIGIFPEGTSHAGPALLPLKTGAARIVLGAEAEHGFGLKTAVVPVGLNFMDRDIFRSDALAVYGDPIDTAFYAELYRAEPHRASRELTDELEKRLRAITLNLREKEEELLLEQLKKVFRHELPEYVRGDGPAEEYRLNRAMADAYYRELERDPEKVRSLRRRISGYLRLIRTARLRPGVADLTPSLALAYLAWVVPLGLLGLPIALHGLVHNWLAYRLPGWYTDWTDTEEVERATFKVAVGLLSFPLFYLAQTALCWKLFGGACAALYLASLPPSGLFALAYFEAARVFLTGMRSFFAFVTDLDFTARLNSLRQEIRRDLSEIAQRYAS